MSLEINPEDVMTWETKKLWNTLNTLKNDADLSIDMDAYNKCKFGIIWFGAILIYTLAGVVMPLFFIYQGITTDTGGNPFQNITIALLMFIFNLLLTIKGWFMVTNIASLSSDGFITAIFWVGFTLTWLCCVIVTPAYVIIKNTQRY